MVPRYPLHLPFFPVNTFWERNDLANTVARQPKKTNTMRAAVASSPVRPLCLVHNTLCVWILLRSMQSSTKYVYSTKANIITSVKKLLPLQEKSPFFFCFVFFSGNYNIIKNEYFKKIRTQHMKYSLNWNLFAINTYSLDAKL